MGFMGLKMHRNFILINLFSLLIVSIHAIIIYGIVLRCLTRSNVIL